MYRFSDSNDGTMVASALIVAVLRLMTEHMLNHAFVLIIRLEWIFIDF